MKDLTVLRRCLRMRGRKAISSMPSYVQGKQHVQDNMPLFLTTAIRRARPLTSSRLLVRIDAGNDAEANMHT